MTLRNNDRVAFGKVILIGEHAVVFGHRAVAGAIELGVHSVVRPIASGQVSRLRAPAWNLDVFSSQDHPVASALHAIVAAAECGPVDIVATAQVPVAAGLGSSAALSVSIARALRPELGDGELMQLATVGETAFHETPSGIDVALSVKGGMGLFQRESGLSELECPEVSLVIGLSGVSRSTATMVAGVRKRVESSQSAKSAIASIGRLSEEAAIALQVGRMSTLGTLMNACQEQLQILEVSIPTLDDMIASARGAGAIGAKLTGAGGGGAMIALAPGREIQVCAAIEELGYRAFVTRLG